MKRLLLAAIVLVLLASSAIAYHRGYQSEYNGFSEYGYRNGLGYTIQGSYGSYQEYNYNDYRRNPYDYTLTNEWPDYSGWD